jgi:RHS repeat-associated protein
VTTTFAYQGSQLVSQSGGGVNASYLNGPAGVLASTDHTTGAIAAYLPDALGSTLALTDSTGQVTTSYSYDLFGNTTSSAGTSDPNPIRYTGLISGPVMPAGLQDNNARDYSPATGRFISPDPTGMTGSGDNLYGYAGGDPADNSDPSGLQWQLLAAGCAIGGLANDLGGALDGRKHSLGDFFTGGAAGCLNGALLAIDGAGEALDALEGGTAAADTAASTGADGAEDVSTLGDDPSGNGTGEDRQGEDSCITQPNSFPGHTKVKMADGTTKPISEVKPGDKVLATNPKTGKTQAEPVLAIIRGHKTEHYAALTITTGRGRHQKTGVIIATTGHPFYDLTRHAWTPAGNLHPGNHLDTLTGTRAVLTGIRHYDQHQATAYNLTIGTDHDYYINAAGAEVLVHNAGCDVDAMAKSGERPAGRGGLTKAGLSYQEHMGRGELPRVPGSQFDSAGQTLLEDILTNPDTKWAPVRSGQFAGGESAILPNGIGAAFDRGGDFQYFGRYTY